MAPPLSIDGGLSFTTGIRPGAGIAAPRSSSVGSVDPTARRELTKLGDQLRTLRRALERLNASSRVSTSNRTPAQEASNATAVSLSSLALDPVATFTTLGSTQEVNATTTSFGPFGPTVSGNTTSLPTVGGTYSDALQDDVLTFTFRDNATVGTNDKLRVRVRNSAGDTIDNLNFRNIPAGTTHTLSNGLTLALGAGEVFKNDSFQVNVFTSVGSAVDPSLSFDGTRNDDPNLQLGFSVVAGSFDVNGTTISVAADDSIDSVLAKISASAAGVDARFDVATETVLLTQKTAGSEPQIVVGNDSSGFLAATKLEGAASVAGLDGLDPVHQPIAGVSALAAIQTGTMTINGVQVGLDVAVDSLGDVLDRINQSEAGVAATLDPETQRLRIVSEDPESALVLDDGDSGFFTALKITPGTYHPHEERDAVLGRGFQNEALLSGRVRGLRRALNSVFSSRGSSSELGRAQTGLRETLLETFTTFFGEPRSSRARSGFGIDFLQSSEGSRLEFDVQRFRRGLGSKAESIGDFLFLDDSEETKRGLIPSLLATVDLLQDSVAFRLGSAGGTGRLVDLRA